MLIDTTNQTEMEKYEILKEKLILEKKEKGNYTADDIVLVRVTDHLPANGIILSISNVPFVAKMNDLSFEAIDSILEEQGLSWEERKGMARGITPLSTQYRSSIHFCLNGVVSSHLQGNFEGNPFVIIEPFKEHEKDDNILAVRGEDTYFKDGLALSNNAVVLVNENYAEKVLNSEMAESKVIFYRGEQGKAIEAVLINMGIVPEIIGKDYIISSDTSEFIEDFIKDKCYPGEKHCFSDTYREDDQKTFKLWKKYADNFYTYLYTNVYGQIEDKKVEIEMLSSADRYDSKAISTLKGLIKSIGIDTYKSLVTDYNNSILSKIENKEYPNNNQILEGEPLGYSNQNITK